MKKYYPVAKSPITTKNKGLIVNMVPSILIIPLLLSNQVAGFASATSHVGRALHTRLHGGYDATVGADPSTPLQLFVLPVSGQPKPDWYLKINPRGKVPALRVPSLGYDAIIYESGICNEFLCDYASMTLGKQHQLLPESDPLIRAKIRLWNDHCDTVYSKTQFTFLMNKHDQKNMELKDEMENALLFYEDILENSDGPYFIGEQFSIADIHLFPFIQRMVVTLKHWKGYEMPADKFPNMINWIKKCSERESVKLSSMGEDRIIEVYSKFIEVDYQFGGLNKNT
eukprot:scaffold218443_cov83-Cyclotella_meneghiniana.AAC.1